MKIFLQPIGLHSIAMIRVMNALIRFQRRDVQIVHSIEEADVVILHVIGLDACDLAPTLLNQGKKYIAIQYCGCWNLDNLHAWDNLWSEAEFVWSYYDLSQFIQRFYYAPLGVDDAFLRTPDLSIRRSRVLTSGYVSGRPQEAIEDVWIAANKSEVESVHLGPNKPSGVISDISTARTSYHNIDDISLAHLYSSCQWVSAMRYQEGFELPAIEGLVRGARPICFDQPSIRHWYGELVDYVPECDGEELIDRLCEIFLDRYEEVTQTEIDYVKRRFDWQPIAGGFWKMVMDTYDK